MKLKKNQVKAELAKAEGWKLRGKHISKLFLFENFVHGIRFVNRVAKHAEAMNHHPDITIQYNKIRLSLTTHDEGGLTMKDIKLAHRINQIRRN